MSSSAPCTEELKRENTELTKNFRCKGRAPAAKDKIIALHEENKRLAESVSAVVTPTEACRGQSPNMPPRTDLRVVLPTVVCRPSSVKGGRMI